MRTVPSLAVLLLLISCATTAPEEPRALCQAAATELSQCAEAVRQWQAQGAGQRPACIEEAEPAVTRVVQSGGASYPDDPQSRSELQRIAKNLEMSRRFLQREKLVEAGLLLGKIEDRCARLP